MFLRIVYIAVTVPVPRGSSSSGTIILYLFFFFKQKTAYEIMPSLVGSEMCIRDRTQLDPEYNNSGVRIPAAHVQDEFDFFRCMLIWMTVGTM